MLKIFTLSTLKTTLFTQYQENIFSLQVLSFIAGSNWYGVEGLSQHQPGWKRLFQCKSKQVNKIIFLSFSSVLFPKELDQIFESHTHFMKDLEMRLQNWKLQGIVGDIFTKLSSSYHVSTSWPEADRSEWVHEFLTSSRSFFLHSLFFNSP